MKRSKFAGLAMMGAAPFLLIACDSQPPAQEQAIGPVQAATAYRSVDECIAEGIYTEKACTDAFNAAQQQLPRFPSAHDCETMYGNCQQVVMRDGSSAFMPAMMGFMLGHMLAGGNRTIHHQPIYYDRHNRGDWSAATSSAQARMSRSAAAQHSTGTSRQSGQAVNSSRRGFGSSAAARGGWGS